MSLTIEDIPKILLDTNKYNYLSELLTLDQSLSYNELTIHQQQLFNTLELFTFGNYQQYLKYKDKYIELDGSLLNKLLELTLITINFENINQTINYQDIKDIYGIDIINNNNNNNHHHHHEKLISLIIKLNFQKIINIKINDIENKLIINRGIEKHLLRDIYNSNKINYKLKILNELNDINIRSVNIAKNYLRNWINEKLIPLKNEFEKKLLVESNESIEKNEPNNSNTSNSSSSDMKSTRKRKVSDNV
ncbi:conserved hypothetical protein [Candida dubliniensis CD36]|uniref:Uncharacterized protein n=1 Tax=Candida dubliniensis (strain CD36 / ATCC MYA-646 / CBS 7987 / NCPF 3949 / NRRL Y-17841) TaxID=573826 RepID=B9W7G8_CANDC|nr:conserved hypothetical protein [Candida dubliniensis CD36]CAX44628.1 conserved hypothetical protein [Candida dubliniensis CD36]